MRPFPVLTALFLLVPAVSLAAPPRRRPPARKPAPVRAGPDLPSRTAGKPAAVVNGEAIPLSTYVDRLSVQFGPQVREMLIQEALLRQEARRRKIQTTPAEIEATVRRALAATVQQYGDEARLARELKQTRGWSLADYREVIRAQAEPQVLRDRLAKALVPDSTVTARELEEAYRKDLARFEQPERVRISHILVRRPAENEPDQERAARERAEALLRRARSGGPGGFEQVAREASEDAATRAAGGKMPAEIVRGANPFGAAFEAAVFTAEPGLLGEVIASPVGFHVIRVDDRKAARTLPLSEVQEQIRAGLLGRRRAAAVDELLLRLRTAARVQTGKF